MLGIIQFGFLIYGFMLFIFITFNFAKYGFWASVATHGVKDIKKNISFFNLKDKIFFGNVTLAGFLFIVLLFFSIISFNLLLYPGVFLMYFIRKHLVEANMKLEENASSVHLLKQLHLLLGKSKNAKVKNRYTFRKIKELFKFFSSESQNVITEKNAALSVSVNKAKKKIEEVISVGNVPVPAKDSSKKKKMFYYGYPFFFLVFIPLIIIPHEFGHFFLFKNFNVEVKTFSIGFGPKLVQKKIGKTNYRLSMIPLGGYVEPNKKSFKKMTAGQKLITYAAGPVVNIMMFFILLIIIKVRNKWKWNEVNLVYSFWQELAFLSLLLGILNLLPLSFLDGGKIFVILWNLVLGPMNENSQFIFNMFGLACIIMIFFSRNIAKPFKFIRNRDV